MLSIDREFVTQELREIWRCCWALGYVTPLDAESKIALDESIAEITRRVDTVHAAVDVGARSACAGIVDEIDERIAA